MSSMKTFNHRCPSRSPKASMPVTQASTVVYCLQKVSVISGGCTMSCNVCYPKIMWRPLPGALLPISPPQSILVFRGICNLLCTI